LICCDSVSTFIRSEVVEQNERAYLRPLYKKVLESSEFKPATIRINGIPDTESGDKFLEQFFGSSASKSAIPVALTAPFKKARIMEHWAVVFTCATQLGSV
jgi:hypothetical protein